MVTGANSGVGFQIALMLARRNATVILACRSSDKANEAASRIVAETGNSKIVVVQMDLAELRSVRSAAAELACRHKRIDLLVNNAGIAMPPHGLTAEGVELQFAVNHLGHFAWTGLLLDSLRNTPGSRVVSVSSIAHYVGRMRFDDLGWSRGYRSFAAYAQSKLANLMFTYELDRRLRAAGCATIATAGHPGGSRSELIRRRFALLPPGFLRLATQFQSPAMGALPTLRAALDPDAQGGDYFGPSGFLQLTGFPIRVESNGHSRNQLLQKRLWQVSEERTGVTFPL